MDRDAMYYSYVCQHKQKVLDAYDKLRDKLRALSDPEWEDLVGNPLMRQRIIEHDNSKFQEPEWSAYLDYFYFQFEDNNVPQLRLDKIEEDFDKAWENHYRNPQNWHHWEHWVYGDAVYDMVQEAILEMACDWIAMGNAKEYWKEQKGIVQMTEKSQQQFLYLLDLYYEKGEGE